MLAALRRARYGSLLALQILLRCAAGRTPTDIATALFCSRSSVYRTVRAYREGTLGWEHDAQGRLMPPKRTTGLLPMLRRSLMARLKATLRANGWCRTRWSWATLAMTLQAKRGITVMVDRPPTGDAVVFTDSRPRANPIERAFGDGHDCCTRNHQREALISPGGRCRRTFPTERPLEIPALRSLL